MSNETTSNVMMIRTQLLGALSVLVQRRDKPSNSWDAEWWRTLDFEWKRTVETTLRKTLPYVPTAYREQFETVTDDFENRLERQVRPFFSRSQWPESSRRNVLHGLEALTDLLSVIESQLIQPEAQRPTSPPLSRRLTNGELPKLPSLPSFQPALTHDADSSVLRGQTVLLLAATLTERNAILARLQPPTGQERIYRVFESSQTYYVGRLGSVAVALTTSRAGSELRDGSALVTYEAIGLVRPRAVVAIGIAFGGYTEKLRIGDVLVSTHVIPYGPARVQVGGNIPRGGEHDAGALLLNRFLEARDWTFERSDGYRCKVVDGRMLSGSRVVDTLNFKTELFCDHPEAIGGEMEGTGIYAASERQGISEWLIVKSVCDWGDGTKGDSYHALAATVATALVEHVFTPNGVLNGLRPFPNSPDQQDHAQSQVGVANINTHIGMQNIVYGAQTLMISSVEADALMDAIQTFIDKGHLDDAAKRIDEADNRIWSRLTPPQQARMRALRGVLKAERGDEQGAARDFFEAHDLAPDEQKAPARKSQALLLQNRLPEAYALARSTLTQSPHHPHIRWVLIRSAPADIPLSDLLPPNWRDSGLATADAVASFDRVRAIDISLAEELLLSVRDPKPDDKFYWWALGAARSQRIMDGERAGVAIPDAKREELVTTLLMAYSSIVAPTRPQQRGVIALDLAVCSKQLGRGDDYKRWLSIAKELIPESVHLRAERAHEAIAREDFESACDLLRLVVASPERPELARVVFANVLLKLNTVESKVEACQILDEVASDINEPPRDRATAALRLVEAQMDDAPTTAACSIERHTETLGLYRTERLRLALAHETRNVVEAKACAARIVANTSRYSTDELLDLGSLIGELRLHEECICVLEPIAPRATLAHSTIALINSGMELGRLELVGSVCKMLRENGIGDHQVAEGEAYVLSSRGDLSGALALVQDWLGQHGDDKRIRFLLCHIANELGRTELLATRADQLPEPTDVHPEVAPDVVRILRSAGEYEEARRFAYRNLKRRRRDAWAWQAISIAGLPRTFEHPNDKEDDSPISVPVLAAGPGMAVEIKERDASRWIQLEENDDLVSGDEEYGPTHPMAVRMAGKKVGDHVELQKAQFGFPARSVEIVAITGCFTRTYQHCNEHYELQFPDLPFIHSFHVPESVDDLVAMLLASAKERERSIDELIGTYGNNPRISLHGLAKACKRSVFELIPLLVSKNSFVHASRSSETMDPAREALRRSREIVIETTAIPTLGMLQMLGRVRAYFEKIWIARATLDRLRAYVQRAISSGATAHMGLEGERLFYSKRDNTFEQRRAQFLREVVATLETWDVFDERERGLLTSTSWDNWTNVAGGGTADSVHRSKRLYIPLWTDDVAVAASAAHEGALPISTQAVFETLVRMASISQLELAGVGAQLVGWRYVDTRTSPQSFLAAAQIAHWDPAARPFVQHMELLTLADWPDANLVFLVAEVFRLWWRSEQLDRCRVDTVVVATLIRLSARANSKQILAALRVAVRLRFGLDVIGAQHVTNTIENWVRSHPH